MQSLTQPRQTVLNLIDTLALPQLSEVANFISFIKKRDENKLFKELETASLSSTDFWNNELDDEVWNNV